MRDFDERVRRILTRAHEMADEPLEGIDEAAKELAELAGGDVAVVARVRQIAVQPGEAEQAEHGDPSHSIRLPNPMESAVEREGQPQPGEHCR